MAVISARLEQYSRAKTWLDSVENSQITHLKKSELAVLYNVIGNNITNEDETVNKHEKLDCYRNAAKYYANTKNWRDYCKIGLSQLKLLGQLRLFKESRVKAQEILNSVIRLSQEEIGMRRLH